MDRICVIVRPAVHIARALHQRSVSNAMRRPGRNTCDNRKKCRVSFFQSCRNRKKLQLLRANSLVTQPGCCLIHAFLGPLLLIASDLIAREMQEPWPLCGTPVHAAVQVKIMHNVSGMAFQAAFVFEKCQACHQQLHTAVRPQAAHCGHPGMPSWDFVGCISVVVITPPSWLQQCQADPPWCPPNPP